MRTSLVVSRCGGGHRVHKTTVAELLRRPVFLPCVVKQKFFTLPSTVEARVLEQIGVLA